MLNVSRSDYHFISLCLPIDVDIQFGFIWHVGYLSKLQKQFYIFLLRKFLYQLVCLRLLTGGGEGRYLGSRDGANSNIGTPTHASRDWDRT